jgi:hypothetical protein
MSGQLLTANIHGFLELKILTEMEIAMDVEQKSFESFMSR